ncbi:MAG: plasmid mobilization relaxosome protein MobC, partial [Hyphomicrobium sp.]
VPDALHAALIDEAAARTLTLSKLANAILAAHVDGQRAALPQRNTNAAAIRELARIGNNLNQLAKQANNALVPLSEVELRSTLAAVIKAIDAL